jgi:acyl-coenzyme A thioesterase PaaI-like protein
LFSGYLAALADQVLTFAAMTVMPDGVAFRSVNLQVQFLKVGRAHPLLIEARVTSAAKQLVSVEADFRREDRELVARASAQQLVQPLAPG